VQLIVVQERDNPPWYESTAETYDRLQAEMTAAEIEQCGERIGREVAAWKAKDELYKNKIAPISDLVPMRQLWCRDLWANQKRELWRPGMVRSKTETEIKRILLQDGVPPLDHMWLLR
jgi:hypothetical protein